MPNLTLPCVEFEGCRDVTGYGRIRRNGKLHMAHRWAYEQEHGPIPDGLVIDHLCHNRGCINVEHLEPTTREANAGRDRHKPNCPCSACAVVPGYCAQGHDLSVHRGLAGCKACQARRSAEFEVQRKAKRQAARAARILAAR